MYFLTLGEYSRTDSILKLIGLLFLCAIVIAASYFVTRLVGKRQSGNIGNSNFKSLDVYRINQNKYLQLIQIGTRYFVIAVCKDTVSMLAELNKEDITYWRSEAAGLSFKDILSKANFKQNSAEADNSKEASESEAEE